MGWGWLNPIADAAGLVGGVAKVIQGNQTKQRNKGLISQAYRQNVAQANLQQANTREGLNESLNARGVLSPGAGSVNPSSITQAVAASGGKGGGGGITAYLPPASAGSVGAANTLAGGENAQMSDQFALEDKANKSAETAALNANNTAYLDTIGGAVAQGVGTAANIASGMGAGNTAATIAAATQQPGALPTASGPTIADNSQMTGAYGMPVNHSFFGGGTTIGNGQPNYSFSSGAS
jgi:hypothetical protein